MTRLIDDAVLGDWNATLDNRPARTNIDTRNTLDGLIDKVVNCRISQASAVPVLTINQFS
jgi:hypothetical protein